MSKETLEEVQLLEDHPGIPLGDPVNKGTKSGGSQRGNGPGIAETSLLLQHTDTTSDSSDTTTDKAGGKKRGRKFGKEGKEEKKGKKPHEDKSPDKGKKGKKAEKKCDKKTENGGDGGERRDRKSGGVKGRDGPSLTVTVPDINPPSPAVNTPTLIVPDQRQGSPRPSRTVGRTFVMVGPPEFGSLSPMGSPLASPQNSPLNSPVMSRQSRSLLPGGPRGRSRTPAGTSSNSNLPGVPAPERGIRSRSPSPVPQGNHVLAGTYVLAPPEITYDEVATAPSSPVGRPAVMMGDIRLFGSSHQLHHNKAVMVTPTGSLLAVNQSPLELRESTLSVNYPDMGDDGEEVSLMYARHEKIPMQDFAGEIRATMDVENFLNQAQLMLNMSECSMESILERMLHHLLSKEEPPSALDEARKYIFTHDSVHQLAKTIQGTCSTYGGGFDYDQSWLCILCTVPSVQKRHVAIARLKCPANLGRTSQEVYFIILVVTPTKEKGTKNALETGRTFSTLFADMDLRLRLLAVHTEDEFKTILWEHMKELSEEQSHPEGRKNSSADPEMQFEQSYVEPEWEDKSPCCIGRGLRADFRRRIKVYLSDYRDGFVGHKTIHKTISTTVFLYFACILPSIALGVLNDNNTKGKIDVKKVIYSQSIGGLTFAIFGGQPMVILLTTAPLALFTKVIYTICGQWGLDFPAMYGCVGMWNSVFLLIYALSDASCCMKWSTRSTEEIFALFISIAFAVDAFKDAYKDFGDNYHAPNCDVKKSVAYDISNSSVTTAMPQEGIINAYSTDGNISGGGNVSSVYVTGPCLRENSILYLLLMVGTVWLGLSLYNFTKTPFLNSSKRELLADCALPVSVLLMSFFGSYIFQEVRLEPFHYAQGNVFKKARIETLPWPAVLGAMPLGFCLSLLFFMDQNISGAMVTSPESKTKKGPAFHWDLAVVAILNAILTLFGLPMVHGALPHSPLHLRAMADVEDRVDQGHVYQKIMHVRETRITGIFSHIFIGLSLLLLPYPLSYIPRAVLNGLFLYLAITALATNQLFERIMLLVTEQAAYPPNHYIRSVPQRKVHLFTFAQLLQLGVMCGFGFSPFPYLKMVFPILIMLLIPIRLKLLPYLIEKKYLEALDGH